MAKLAVFGPILSSVLLRSTIWLKNQFFLFGKGFSKIGLIGYTLLDVHRKAGWFVASLMYKGTYASSFKEYDSYNEDGYEDEEAMTLFRKQIETIETNFMYGNEEDDA